MDIQERINQYWSMRADEFSDAQLAELKEYKRMNWTEQIKRALPDKKRIRALDLGTGAGFFSIILHDLNCEVVGIDYSQEMINHAIMNSEKLNCNDIWFLRMDAQALEFPDESFDFIFTRNVTWTLPDPEKAYQEMIRVLAPGGRLYFEVGIGQADNVLRIMRTQGFGDIQVVKDHHDIPRVVFGTLCTEL